MLTIKSESEINKSEIESMVKAANGKRRNRIAGKREVEQFVDLLNEHFSDGKSSIRVYSRDGFVANSYNYRAEITYIQATKVTDGWQIYATTGDAKRGYGKGALVTIDGRGV